jgi:hypothetical protein
MARLIKAAIDRVSPSLEDIISTSNAEPSID